MERPADIPKWIDQLWDRNPGPRAEAREQLAAAGPAAVPALAKALSNDMLVVDAIETLSTIGGAASANALLGRIDQGRDKSDPKDRIRLMAARALRRMAVPESVDGIRRRLSYEKKATALAKALFQALVGISTPEALLAAA